MDIIEDYLTHYEDRLLPLSSSVPILTRWQAWIRPLNIPPES